MEDLDFLSADQKETQRELTRMARKNKLKRKMTAAVMVCILFVITIAMVWLGAGIQQRKKNQAEIDALNATIEQQKKEIDELKNTPMVVNPVSPKIVVDMIRSEVGEIGELATVEYLFTNAARFQDSKQIFDKWDIFLTEKSFILKWDGTIKAGVDLQKVSFDIKDETILIALPQPEILSYEVDNDSVEVMDEKNNVFNPITVDDKVNFDAKTEESMIERAIENGLLEKAQNSAQDIITRLLTANPAISKYTVEFITSE